MYFLFIRMLKHCYTAHTENTSLSLHCLKIATYYICNLSWQTLYAPVVSAFCSFFPQSDPRIHWKFFQCMLQMQGQRSSRVPLLTDIDTGLNGSASIQWQCRRLAQRRMSSAYVHSSCSEPPTDDNNLWQVSTEVLEPLQRSFQRRGRLTDHLQSESPHFYVSVSVNWLFFR